MDIVIGNENINFVKEYCKQLLEEACMFGTKSIETIILTASFLDASKLENKYTIQLPFPYNTRLRVCLFSCGTISNNFNFDFIEHVDIKKYTNIIKQKKMSKKNRILKRLIKKVDIIICMPSLPTIYIVNIQKWAQQFCKHIYCIQHNANPESLLKWIEDKKTNTIFKSKKKKQNFVTFINVKIGYTTMSLMELIYNFKVAIQFICKNICKNEETKMQSILLRTTHSMPVYILKK